MISARPSASAQMLKVRESGKLLATPSGRGAVKRLILNTETDNYLDVIASPQKYSIRTSPVEQTFSGLVQRVRSGATYVAAEESEIYTFVWEQAELHSSTQEEGGRPFYSKFQENKDTILYSLLYRL